MCGGEDGKGCDRNLFASSALEEFEIDDALTRSVRSAFHDGQYWECYRSCYLKILELHIAKDIDIRRETLL